MDSHFLPMTGFTNPHLQTLLPRVLRRRVLFTPHWQRLELPDGDFIDLAWSENPQSAYHKPRVVLFHGLEGSFYSPYAHGLLHSWRQRGWLGVVMHFRGCSGEPNRNSRLYHSGETGDARFFLSWLTLTLGKTPTAAVGISLGGNVLAYYLAEEGDNPFLDAAVIVSAPLLLEACANHIEQGFSRLYNRYLLRLLKKNALRKLHRYPDTLPVPAATIEQLKTIREFDEVITAKVHNFSSAEDYYQRCSALPLLPAIKKPLLIIHAEDDPFIPHDVIPIRHQLPDNIDYQLTRYGGHVGFISGTLHHPIMWLERRIPSWLQNHLEK